MNINQVNDIYQKVKEKIMVSFYVKNGCFYYKGKPFIKTSAYGGGEYIISLPEELVETEENLYLKAGFTSVDFFAHWRKVRPSEDVWNLEPFRILLRRARKMGITVFIHFFLTPPRWMVDKYNWYWVTETGRRVPVDVVGGYYHDENYLRELEEYIKHLIEVGMEYEDALGDYWLCGEHWPFLPSFKERKIYGTREDATYDEYTISKFRKWLANQFSLDELGLRWNNDENTYSSWNEVYPPVSFKPTDFKGRTLAKWKVARWDWYRFKQYVSVDILTKFCQIVQKYDPYRPISLEMNMDLPGWYGYQRWYKVCSRAKNARAAIQDFEASYVRALYYIAIARGSSEPPHQVNEMSGFQDYKWCIRNAWFVQAMGGTGMTFWDFKSDYWGVVTSQKREYDPREKPQFKQSFLAVMELNKIFRRLSHILGASPPLKPTIGILILDEDSYHESGVSIPPTMRFLSILLKLGFGAETAIINEEYLLDGRVNNFKLVIAPHIKYISYKEAEGLRTFVKNGGVLLVGPFCAEYDEKDIPKLIIENNLHGIDLDDRAVQLAQLGLYIKARKKNRSIKTLNFNVVSSDFFLPDYEEVQYIFEEDSNLGQSQRELIADIWSDLQLAYKFGSLLQLDKKLKGKLKELEEEQNQIQPDMFVKKQIKIHKDFAATFFNNLNTAVKNMR